MSVLPNPCGSLAEAWYRERAAGDPHRLATTMAAIKEADHVER